MAGSKRFAEIRDKETGKVLMEFIGPGTSDDPISIGLRMMTHQLRQLYPKANQGSGFFGGSFGYGVDFENSTFLMHHFCWCERDDCMWCGGCSCERDDKVRYYIDGIEVSGDEHWKRNEEFLGPLPHVAKKQGTKDYEIYRAEWDARILERNRRWSTIYPAERHHCEPSGIIPDREAGPSSSDGGAPNFWHKPSGFQVHWYKYIGRDNVASKQIGWPQWEIMLRACLASINGPPLEDALLAYAKAEEEAHTETKRQFERMAEVLNER
jgi:hypothetical protein